MTYVNMVWHLREPLENGILHSKAVSFTQPFMLNRQTHGSLCIGLRGQMGQELTFCMLFKKVQYSSSDPQWSP